MLTIIKVIILLLLLSERGTGNTLAILKKKKISKVSFQMSAERIRSMAKLKRKGNPFLEGARMGAAL